MRAFFAILAIAVVWLGIAPHAGASISQHDDAFAASYLMNEGGQIEMQSFGRTGTCLSAGACWLLPSSSMSLRSHGYANFRFGLSRGSDLPKPLDHIPPDQPPRNAS